jgi:four helix bundle protein
MEGQPDDRQADLLVRTKRFALEIIELCSALPRTSAAQVLGKQLIRSGTSVGANYREARRGRSPAEFISKLEIAQQELDETSYWLELLAESGTVPAARLASNQREATELMAMIVASLRTLKSRQQTK